MGPDLTRFRVLRAFALPGRSLACAAGAILEGRIRAGQPVIEPAGLPPVAAVELLLLGGPGSEELPCLCFAWADDDERARLAEALLPGAELRLGA